MHLPEGIFDPLIQNIHLFLCMEPVLPLLHNGERRAGLRGESGDGLPGSQMILSAIQNTGGNAPADGMLPHIAQVLP